MKNKDDILVSPAEKELQLQLERQNSALLRLEHELKIESALDKVRARTMAMHRSDELSETVYILFQQFKELGENPDQATIGIINEDEWVIEYWVTMHGQQINKVFKFSIDEPNVTQRIYQAWKGNVKSLVINLSGQELHNFTAYRASMGGAPANPMEERRFINVALFADGLINVQSTESRSAESLRLLERFAAVFGQTYTRFLDLKKAEAQVRESQIQLALERVRAKTMAMQHSDDLKSAATLLFQQVKALGAPAYSCGYNIWEDEDLEFTSWMSTQDGTDINPVLNIPLTEDANFIRFIESRKNGEDFYVMELRGERMQEHYHYLKTIPAFRDYFEYAEKAGFSQPETQIHHLANFSHGNLLFITLEPCPEFHDIFKRFAVVFDQTYTRFLDLQRAEAQAREAQIEAALERVRSRSMAMHRSEEVKEVATTLYEELQKLEFKFGATTIILMDKETGDQDHWVAGFSQKLLPESCRVSYFKHPCHDAELTAWKNGEKFLVYKLTGEERLSYNQTLFSKTGYKNFPAHEKEWMLELDPVVFSLAFMKHGALMWAPHPSTQDQLEILHRFAKVFEQTYTRFLDLQKAESQARDSQIELAIERVRARAMAMHSSNELSQLAATLFEELIKLDLVLARCIIWILDKETFSARVWMANSEDNKIADSFFIKRLDHSYYKEIINQWKARNPKWLYELKGDDKTSIDKLLLEETELSQLPEAVKQGIMSAECTFISGSFSNFGLIEASGPVNYSEEQLEILHRFGKVFDQTYTRFLDLQKSEAQARESQIELALERVRARTMAMQKSEELAETATVLFQQVKGLGIPQWTCGFSIWELGDKEFTWYPGSPEGKIISPSKIPLTEHPVFIEFDESRKRGEELLVYEKKGQVQKDHYRYMLTLPGGMGKVMQDMLDAGISFPEYQIDHIANFSHGNLAFITYEPVPEAHDIFKRFAKVFEQTYTRFLDLQKAEAQAREARIENALEKVRSRTMAMQRSDELKDAALLLFQQVELLGVPAFACGFNIWDEDRKFATAWMAREKNNAIQSPFKTCSSIDIFLQIYEAAQRGESLFVKEQAGRELEVHNEYMATIHIFREMTAKMAEAGLSFPSFQIMHCAFFAQGYLMFISQEPCPESHDIFIRFAKVFEQTYTRFLDLQKSETQARESQIQLALERVRARTMAMQSSGELKDIIQVVYDQFVFLNLNIEHTGFIIDYKERNDMNIWLADKNEIPTQVVIPYFDTPHWNSFIEAKEKGTNFFSNHLDFEGKNKFYKDLFALIPGLQEETKQYYYSRPALAISTVLLENVGLYIENFSGTPYTDEENDTLMRFGKVFQQTYTRFLDLQKAEALARETIQRASVDRIRAEIASMRTTTDLERITPLIWNELTTIGVPFIRCGVFIMDEEHQQVNTFLSTPEGKGVAASFHLPYNANPETTRIVGHWNRKEIYRPHWDEAAFIDFTKVLAERGGITTGEKFLVESRPTDLYLHFIPFIQGMLYVGDTSPLSDEHLQLVNALAEAFSTAYARYEDFNKLESAKAQIEKTLVDLKQAQSQLVQAEKMASLGELTAGIAHEIQNPLNFVNNFSEVNQELITEMRQELEKGNLEEVAEMAKQIGDNEGKILHHGKRADAIVKGMLQHSRTSTSTKEPTDINALADEYFRLAYHGMRAKDKSFNAAMPTCYDSSIGRIPIIPQDMGRVLLNLYNNAFYAVHEKKKTSGNSFEPTVSVSTTKKDGKVEITVKDNGNGIPQKVVDKIFQPFFTTKPTGQGTGLGLSLSYDVVKAHGGEIRLNTSEGEFTEFVVCIPVALDNKVV